VVVVGAAAAAAPAWVRPVTGVVFPLPKMRLQTVPMAAAISAYALLPMSAVAPAASSSCASPGMSPSPGDTEQYVAPFSADSVVVAAAPLASTWPRKALLPTPWTAIGPEPRPATSPAQALAETGPLMTVTVNASESADPGTAKGSERRELDSHEWSHHFSAVAAVRMRHREVTSRPGDNREGASEIIEPPDLARPPPGDATGICWFLSATEAWT
jgi:hypothetical protein